jgi:hypothetical protein
VQAGGTTTGELRDRVTLQEQTPERLVLPSGAQGRSTVSVTWIVTGTGTATLEYRSQKGGTHRRTVQVR